MVQGRYEIGVEEEQPLLGLQGGPRKVLKPLRQLASDVRPRSHWRERNPKVSLDTQDVNCRNRIPLQMGVRVEPADGGVGARTQQQGCQAGTGGLLISLR